MQCALRIATDSEEYLGVMKAWAGTALDTDCETRLGSGRFVA
jgi:hypothetical protein